MSEIPTLSQYDGKKAKVRCSILWILSEAYNTRSYPKNLPHRDVEHIFESDGGLKNSIAALLCSGDPYCKLVGKMFDMIEPLQSHEDVIQVLCSKGLYVLDDADSLITANDLRKMPLALSCHLIIIDMLMFAYVSMKLASTNSLVMTVKKFSQFSASKELPDNLGEAFILWLNKSSAKVESDYRSALESDKHTFGQTREDNSEFPTITNLTEDLYDGRSLALLLHYYCPDHVSLRDISLGNPISIADAWHNLQLSLNFCNDILLPMDSPWDGIPPSVLHPVDVLYCSQEMKPNMMAFFGTLFHYLETEALQDVVCPLGHSVLCRRQRVVASEDVVNNSENTFKQPLTFMTMDERHRQIMAQASQWLPGVQPLISDATKQSFVKEPSMDTDSVSTITYNESEDRDSPAPFSSKPLLVRRNRDQPSFASKLHAGKITDHLPLIKTHSRADCNYVSDDGDTARSNLHPIRKSGSYHGLAKGEPSVRDCEKPIVNKWNLRSPIQDLRNTNTSNNTFIKQYSSTEPYRLDQKSLSQTKESGYSELLPNVEMDSDGENAEVRGLMKLHTEDSPSTTSEIGWSTAVSEAPFDTPGRAAQVRNKSDLMLETARTADFLSARSYPNSRNTENLRSTTSEFTSVSSRTTSNATSSNESASQELAWTSDSYSRQIPNVVHTENSPNLPRNVTHVMPYSNPDSDEHFSPRGHSSQKSYTVQNGEFQSVDSARAAGYPIIDPSPERHRHNHQPMRVPYEEGINILSQMSSHSPRNGRGAGDPGVLVHNRAQEEHMVIGGTVVKLRSPKKSSRSARNVKTASWTDTAEEKGSNQASDSRRRHSNTIAADKMSAVLKKLGDRRKIIETNRRIEERKKVIEWKKEFAKLQQGSDYLAMKAGVSQKDAIQRNAVSRDEKADEDYHRRGATLKNEDTSSDYSSKSPSPSSLNNHNIGKSENDQRIMRQCGKLDHDIPSHSEDRNFFASPLSTTTYLVNRQDRTDGSFEHSYKSSALSQPSAETQASEPPKTIVLSPEGRQSHLQEKTFNVLQRYPGDLLGGNRTRQKDHTARDQGPTNTMALSSKNHNLASPRGHLGKIRDSKNKRLHHPPGADVTYQVATKEIMDSYSERSHKASYHGAEELNLAHNKGDNNTQNWEARQMTYDVPSHLVENGDEIPHVSSQSVSHKNAKIVHTQPQSYPEINILQPVPSEHTTRRTLFPAGGNQNPETYVEQENIDPNHLTVAHPDQTTYDSFSYKIAGVGSNQSTPHKLSPGHGEDLATPVKGENGSDMSSVLLKTADKDRKGGKGFELVDDSTPNTDVAKKKEQFLLKQLKKEEELKRKRADREKQEEKRKEEARQKQEEIAAKKEEEKLKRQQILEEYKKKKMQQEEAQLMQQSSAIVGGSAKKHPKPELTPHSGRINKASRSGRSSPAPDATPPMTQVNGGQTTDNPTFNISAGSEEGSCCTNAKPLIARKLSSGGQKDWDARSASSSAVSSDYTGPKLYKQPSSKSNKHIVNNAICHCCLPGKVNESLRNNTIQVLEMSNARHFMILFRDAKCQYRALYTYDPEAERLHRLAGNGPINIVPNMIERLFKYNSGRKAFTSLPSKTLSVSIDAITIKNTLWQTNKKPNSAKK